MTGYCMVLTTFESEAQADPVIGEILKEKLAACVQVMPIRSHYVWKEQLCHDPDVPDGSAGYLAWVDAMTAQE